MGKIGYTISQFPLLEKLSLNVSHSGFTDSSECFDPFIKTISGKN